MKKTILVNLILLCCILNALPVTAQMTREDGYPYRIWQDPETNDFKEIQRQAEEYFKGKEDIKGSGYKHWKRWELLMMDRLTADGKITNHAARNIEANRLYSKIEQQFADQRANTGHWLPIATDDYITYGEGYNPGIGRVNVIAFHPTDQNTIYAGTPAGGLWRTTNEGSSWTPLTDGIPRTGVSGIAIDPFDPDIIYILTSDGDKNDTQSIGVLKSTNGGLTWNPTGLVYDELDFVRGFKLVMKPNDNMTLFAVMTDGIWRTENGGIDWTMVRSGSFRDIEFKPGQPDTIYACTINAFHRSLTGGDSWSTIATGLPSNENRSAIAVSPDNPSYVYYLSGPGGPTGSFKGLFRSTNNGSSFSTITTTPNLLDSSVDGMADCTNGCDQAALDLAIAIDPNDADEVITGCMNVWRNEDIDLGTSWTLSSYWDLRVDEGYPYVHADIHDLVYQDNNRLWCASDGGVFLSTDDGLTWTDKTSAGSDNGLTCTQYYRIAGTPSYSSILMGGTQDNGSNFWVGGNDIYHYNGGDGMDCAIDFTNLLIQYHCQQGGRLFKSTDGGISVDFIRPGNSNGGWVSPLTMDPSNEEEIWLGLIDTIYRSIDGGDSWTGFIPLAGTGAYRLIWCAPSDDSIVYVAAGTAIFRNTLNGSGAWTNITGNLPVSANSIITGLTGDIDNANNLWVTLSGYFDGQKVFYNSNGGTTWTNITGSLPNTATNCIIYDDAQVNDNAVYVGNDIGIFYRDATMTDWIPFRNGLPNVTVMDMYVDVAGGTLYAGTYGRGIWASDLYSECPVGYTLTNDNAPGTYPEGYTYYQASSFIHSTRSFYGGVGSVVYYKAGDNIILNPGFRARALDLFEAWIGPCSEGIPDSLMGTGSEEIEVYATSVDGNALIFDGSSPEGALPAKGTFHASINPNNNQILISTGDQTRVTIDLLRNDQLLETLESDLMLIPGENKIPFSSAGFHDGKYQVRIVRGKEVTMLDLKIDDR
jgi:photosystem II stability/assembly factor-like uncharacterized protein